MLILPKRLAARRWWARRVLRDFYSRPPNRPDIKAQGRFW